MTQRLYLPRAASLAVLLALPGAPALAQCELARLVASDGADGDWLGSEVALSGDFGLVAASRHDGLGSDAGAVYVARRGANGWSFVDKLEASDGGPGERFGRALAVDGSHALVGAINSVYAFELVAGSWVEVQKFVPADVLDGDFFGGGIALDGDRALVGAAGHDTPEGEDAGAVYVLERLGGVWTEAAKWTAPDGRSDDGFSAVALDGDLAVVGSSGHEVHGFFNKGAAYVYERGPGGWGSPAKLTIYEGGDGDRFGANVAVLRNRLVVAAPWEDPGAQMHGAVYVFKKVGSDWVREARLIPDSPIGYGFALHDLDVSGDKIFVGCYLCGTPGEDQYGRVLVYKRTAAGWVFEYRFNGTVSNPLGGGNFGSAVAVDGNTVLVGARLNGDQCENTGCDDGAAHLFSLPVESSFNFCASTPNSTGSRAVLSLAGCTEVARNDVRLFARPVPKGKSGIFFYGDGRLDSRPFGDGFRCVAGRVYRLPLTHALNERLSSTLDLTNPPQPAGSITGGSTWFFQAYYRDTAAGGAGFNLSDAIEVVFAN